MKRENESVRTVIASTCPFCCEDIREGAVVCPHCRSILDAAAYARLALSGADRPRGWILGVCAETARRLGLDTGIVRAAFLGLTLLGGHGLAAYFALWLIYRFVPAEAPGKACTEV